jgi:uronate dehydrogenase
VRLVTAALTAPRVGFTVSFGMSDNAVKPVDNRLAGHLGYRPQDNTERFRTAVEAKTPVPDPKAPAVQALGGWFVDLGHPDDEAAT